MKKLLLSFSLVCTLGVSAQVISSDDFTSYTLGNIGSDLTGATAGQGGWMTYVAASGANTDFQVVDASGVNGYALQLTGSNTATNSRFMFKDLSTVWAARTTGYDITEVEYDFFTGSATSSKNSMRVNLYEATGTKILGGFAVAMDTKILSGLAYYDNAGTAGNYSFKLGAGGTDLVLSANTWYRLGFSFDYNTGDILLRESTGLINGTIPGAGAFEDVAEIDVVAGAGTGNTASSVGKFDNIVVRTTDTDTLLLASPTFNTENKFSVYPNPVKDVITVTNTESIAVNGITITDLNGRTVKTVNYNNISDNIQVNVSDLSSGVYMMNIKSDKGSVTKKIVKN